MEINGHSLEKDDVFFVGGLSRRGRRRRRRGRRQHGVTLELLLPLLVLLPLLQVPQFFDILRLLRQLGRRIDPTDSVGGGLKPGRQES